ncbi:MAG: gfo/Idh/MocA family oxidoreductase [Acidobacteria bacterium]|nr:MAG: gfo/Idh/MocA family oxidoreductase [Acidobacteriota bacterium]
MSRVLRGVSVGAGYFGQFHYDAWSRVSGAELVALCDRDPARAENVARHSGVSKFYTDVATMLDTERPDFIDIITPPDTHLALTRLAAARGVHVLCQKALGPSVREAALIVEEAARAGIRFMVHDNFRFQPWHREFRRLLDGESIGRLHSISCRTRMGDGWQSDAYLARQPYFRTMPQLLIFETGVHFIDVYRFLGGEVARVFARLRRLNDAIAGEDTGVVLFEFASGAVGLWDANRYNESLSADPRYTFGDFLLEGDRGALRLDEEGRMLVQRLGERPREHAYHHERRGFAGDCVHATLQHFVDGLRAGTPFETDGRDYLKTLAVQEAVYASAATGAPALVASA